MPRITRLDKDQVDPETGKIYETYLQERGNVPNMFRTAAHRPEIADMASVPGDCPFLPDDLVERLHMARREKGTGVPLACARSGEWRHPVVGLWALALRGSLRKALVEEDMRKIEVWTARHGVAVADWPVEPVDPFLNVNTPEDAERAERIALQHHDI